METLGATIPVALFGFSSFYSATAINYRRILFLLISRKSVILEADLFTGIEEVGNPGTTDGRFCDGLGSEGTVASSFLGNGTRAASGLGSGLVLGLGLGHGLRAPFACRQETVQFLHLGGLGVGSHKWQTASFLCR